MPDLLICGLGGLFIGIISNYSPRSSYFILKLDRRLSQQLGLNAKRVSLLIQDKSSLDQVYYGDYSRLNQYNHIIKCSFFSMEFLFRLIFQKVEGRRIPIIKTVSIAYFYLNQGRRLRIAVRLQSNKMSKKQSIHIKTMDVAQMISIKTQLPKASQQNISPDHMYKTSIRHKTENAVNFGNMMKLAKRQQIIRHKIDRIIKESQASPIKQANQRLSLKQFPKREKSIKNSNPYRYFLSSKSERLPTEDRVITEPVLHFNLTKILNDRYSIRFKCHSVGTRAVTQADMPSLSRKNLCRKNCKSQKKSNESINEELQPWLMTQSDQNNIHPIPFSK